MTASHQTLASRSKRLRGAVYDSFIALVVSVPLLSFSGIPQRVQDQGRITLAQQVFLFFFGVALFLAING